ncbi:phage portal protein [Clostridium sardiniense]
MGFLNLFKSGNSNEIKMDMTTGASNGDENSSGFVNSTAGINVSITEDVALKIASLSQGISIIAETIASMPVYLHKEESGFQQTLLEDRRSRILSGMANDVLTSFTLKRNLIKDLILYGNAYAKIIREGDNIRLIYLPTSIITPKMDSSGYYFEVQSYSTDINGERVEAEVVNYYDMLVLIRNPKFNSLTGTGLLTYGNQVFDMATEETKYMTSLFKNGLSAKAVLSSKTPFKKEVKEQLKKDLMSFYSGSSNAGKMLVLEGDVSVNSLSLTPSDIKLIENKNFTISEIARFLNIPKHMLNLDRGQGTYSNITQERLMLLQQTLTPYTVAFEEALNQKLLDDSEQDGTFYFAFDTSEMLKLTPEDQAQYMLNLYRENVVTLEEVRATLNLGGDADTIAELKMYQELKMKKAQMENSGVNKEVPSEKNEVTEAKQKEVEDPLKTDKQPIKK